MNSAAMKSLSRTSRVLFLPPRPTLTLLYTSQYRPLLPQHPLLPQAATPTTPTTRAFTSTHPLLKKGKKKKQSSPKKSGGGGGGAAPSKGSNKKSSDPPAPARGPNNNNNNNDTADWNSGPQPDAEKWRQLMDGIMVRINAAKSYEEVEKLVFQWTDLLDAGVNADVGAARLEATVRESRQACPRLREWVTVPEDDDLDMWMKGEATDESIAEKRREWKEMLAEQEREEAMEKEREEEEYRRQVVGEGYDRMSEEERNQALKNWEDDMTGKELVGHEKWHAMSKEEKAEVLKEWYETEDKFGRDTFGPEWDVMSGKEKKTNLRAFFDEIMEREFAEEQAAINAAHSNFMEEQRELAEKEKRDKKEGEEGEGEEVNILLDEENDEDEIEDFDPEREGDIEIDDSEDLEAELGGHRDDPEAGELKKAEEQTELEKEELGPGEPKEEEEEEPEGKPGKKPAEKEV